MKLFSGTANPKLAERIAKYFNTPFSQPEKFVFPDGEERIRILEKVVDQDTVLVQPLSPPVNEHIIETSFIVDALKRSGAKSVFLITPYLGYERQDHVFREGEAVSLKVVIKILEAAGVNKVLALDLHSIKIPELFHIPVVHHTALPVFAEKIKALHLEKYNTILISPDMGGIRRIKMLAELLGGMSFASIEKSRDLVTGGVEAKEINVPTAIKTLVGKTACIVDDMISSGGTIVKAVDLLKENGVSKVYVFATHAVFSQNAPVILQESPIENVFVTDSIFVPKDKRFPKLEILSVAEMIAREIKKQLATSN